MAILAKDGSYNHTAFKGKNGTWRLIGVRSEGRNIIDIFKSDRGEYKEIDRRQIPILEANGDIEPVYV